jgi:hypothetical protein
MTYCGEVTNRYAARGHSMRFHRLLFQSCSLPEPKSQVIFEWTDYIARQVIRAATHRHSFRRHVFRLNALVVVAALRDSTCLPNGDNWDRDIDTLRYILKRTSVATTSRKYVGRLQALRLPYLSGVVIQER